MRYARIFSLHFQDALDDRMRMFVWFLASAINPLLLLLFWIGAAGSSALAAGWQRSDMILYYLLLIVANTFLWVHIEENIAYIDIQEGYLANYLLKPVSYLVYKFFYELPYRVLETAFGAVGLVLILAFFRGAMPLSGDAVSVGLTAALFVLAYGISFLFKMILGLSALWTTDFSGLSQMVGVVTIIMGGFVVPVSFYPSSFQLMVYATPFPWMFYLPVTAVLGHYQYVELLRIIAGQLGWIAGLFTVYTLLWKRGVRLFTSVGR